MRRILLLSFFTFSLFHVFTFGQSRTNQITRVCTGSTTPASVAISKAGNITLTPCSGGTITMSGVGVGNMTGPGTSTDNAIVRWDGTTGLVTQNSAVTIADTNGKMTWAQGTLTTSNPFATHTATWNDGSVTFTNFFSNVTDTASAAGSKLIDLQVGGNTKFSVSKTGAITMAGSTSGTTVLTPTAAAGTTTATLPARTITVMGTDEVLRSYLASTVTYNNTAALADTALSVTVAAGGIYKIDLVVHSTNVTRSLNLDFAGTATVTNFIGQWKGATTADSSASGGYLSLGVTAAGTDFSFDGNDGVDGYYKFTGSIEVNAAGTFLLRGAQRAAFASDTTILRGSTLTLTKLN